MISGKHIGLDLEKISGISDMCTQVIGHLLDTPKKDRKDAAGQVGLRFTKYRTPESEDPAGSIFFESTIESIC